MATPSVDNGLAANSKSINLAEAAGKALGKPTATGSNDIFAGSKDDSYDGVAFDRAEHRPLSKKTPGTVVHILLVYTVTHKNT